MTFGWLCSVFSYLKLWQCIDIANEPDGGQPDVHERQRISKILLFIPLFLFLAMIASLILASILENPTDRGVVYTIFALVSVMLIFLSPLPCIIVTILGIYYVKSASDLENVNTKGLLVLGISELVFSVLFFIVTIILFIRLQGV